MEICELIILMQKLSKEKETETTAEQSAALLGANNLTNPGGR